MKHITKSLSIVLALLMLTSVFAVAQTQANDNTTEFEPGAVIVSLKFGSPSVTSLLGGFDIEEARLITPGSDTQNVYLVKFREKTKEIVWEAIEALEKSPYIISAEPDYYQSVDDEVEDIITGNHPSNPITPTQPTTPAVDSTQANDNTAEFEPGAVIVSLKFGSPSVTSLLGGFDIEEARLITPGSDTQNVYLVKFREKTKEIVWEAIDVLEKSPYVNAAEPDYYQSVDDEVEDTISDNSSPTDNSTKPITPESSTDKQTKPVTTDSVATNLQPNEKETTTPVAVKPAVKKKANPVEVTVKTNTVKAKKLKSKVQTIKALTITKAQGKVTATLVKKGTTKSILKKLKISKKGVITLKKGNYKKATYTVKIKITANGNSKYNSKTLTKTVKINIK